MLTLLHASDLHFGKHFDPDAASIFREMVKSLSPDILVVSGDFTQRAKRREFQAAQEFLADLPPIPLVVTPGNHDVPLYRIWERALIPLEKYRRFITPDLDFTIGMGGVSVVSLNSTAPHGAIVNGRLGKAQLLFAARAFGAAPENDLKVLVTHHNLVPDPNDASDQVLPGHQECLRAFSRMGVDLILAGHLHRSFMVSLPDAFPGGHSGGRGVGGMVLVGCGTTSSFRGRGRERGTNSFNLLRVDPEGVEVTPYLRVQGAEEFSPSESCRFPRQKGTNR